MEFITIKNSKIDIEDFSPMNVVFSVVVKGEKLLLVKNKESNFFELPVTESKTFVDNKQKMIEFNKIITNEYELNTYGSELIGICRIRFESWEGDYELLNSQQYEKLVAFRETIVKKHPDSLQAILDLCEAYYLNKDYQKSLEKLSMIYSDNTDVEL